MTTDITAADQDRDIIDLIKEYITPDKKREIEYTNLLKDYISFLKGEIIHKNKLCNWSNIRYKNSIIETRLSNSKKVFSNKDVLKLNDVSLSTTECSKDPVNESKLAHYTNNISTNEEDRILISVDNSDVSNVYGNYEKDDVYCFDTNRQ